MSAEPSSQPKRLSAVDRRLARRQDASGEQRSLPPLTGRNLGQVWPLSPAQRRLLLLDQLGSGSPAYAIARALDWRGWLSPVFFGAALSRVVARHGTLRLALQLDEDGGRGHLLPPRPVVLPWVDVSAMQSTGMVAERLSRCFSRGRLDLAAGQVWQSAWLRLSAVHQRWLFRVHHVVFDGVSMGLMLTELATHYGGFESGRPVELPPLTVEYGDFVLWHEERQRSARALAQLGWWRQQLAGLGSEPELLADRPGGSGQPGQWASLRIPDGFGVRLSLAAAFGTSPFVFLLTALVILLHRGHGRRRCRLLSPAAGRQRLELEPLIGLLAQTLLLSPEVEPRQSFAELVASLSRHLGLVLAHQDIPFERVSEVLGLDGKGPSGGSGAFQLMFAEQADPLAAAPEFAGAGVSCVNLESGASALDLFVEVRRQGAEILLRAGYRSDRFEATTIRRWLGHFLRLLEAALAEPGCAVADLPLFSLAERAQLEREWSRGQEASPAGLLHGGFLARAEGAAESIALEDGDQHWSYGATSRLVRRVAGRLAARGLGAEHRVGLRMARSVTQLVAVLAVLFVGATYVPLESNLAAPLVAERMEIADAQLLLEADSPELSAAAVGGEALPCPIEPRQLAYLIFTSGSTGIAKAVAVSHRAAAAYTETARLAFALAPGDRVLQFASLAFDASVEEIFPTLAAGATLVLRDEAMLSSATAFLGEAARLSVTVLDLPTAFWHPLAAEVAAGQLALPAMLRLVILGGERLLTAPARAWCRTVGEEKPGLVTINTYGPTEATVVATRWRLPASAWSKDDPPEPLIGRPVAGATVYVVGRRLDLVPIGGVGELALSGVGLARGYWRRPAATASRFRPHPWAELGGERLYLSGDLARFRADGNLEMLGRADRQLKVRGFRVEPAAIEARLLEFPELLAAAVMPWPRPGEAAVERLVAYVVARAGTVLHPERLRAFLAERLPPAFLPAVFVQLERLPLGPQGKLDVTALPPPEPSLGEDGALRRPASSAVERLLARLWAEVLTGPEPGLDDHFFHLGGHSLAAMRLVSLLERETGLSLPLATLFASPRLEQLAAALEAQLLAEESLG